ncbi:hypothetical protein TNCV_3889091 [Trichonephila clavipes]|nr:hypothetical protein TNCV_3889091 [Trichonephila clavipes]
MGKRGGRSLPLPQGIVPQYWGEIELNRTVQCSRLHPMTCMHLASRHDEFWEPGSDAVEIRWHKRQQHGIIRTA